MVNKTQTLWRMAIDAIPLSLANASEWDPPQVQSFLFPLFYQPLQSHYYYDYYHQDSNRMPVGCHVLFKEADVALRARSSVTIAGRTWQSQLLLINNMSSSAAFPPLKNDLLLRAARGNFTMLVLNSDPLTRASPL